MENTKQYFIIEKVKYNFDKQPRFNIMKDKAYALSEATKMLIAYEQLNDQEEKTYFLQEVDLILGQEKPLVLNNEVETKANGKEINISEEMPF
tara:strand:+ start:208 stop:486 length:279 start_codon:yes stop_codon:yes gene_type:complete